MGSRDRSLTGKRSRQPQQGKPSCPTFIRQISPPGKSARADEANTVALAVAAVQGQVRIGKYLEWSDPNARHGRGDDRWTDDVAKARKFDSFAAASECWRAISLVRPMRPDGKPNRPLTAYSVTIEKVE